jgi:hypothetical protein
MKFKPFELDKMTNSLGQEIVFLEHPTEGQDAEIICACHELKLADYSTFYDLDDMLADHKEYEPTFVNGKLYLGDIEA